MQGSIRQRSPGSWQVRVYIGMDRLTGKQRYASRTVRGGKRDAQRAMHDMANGADSGRWGRTEATVGELLERWFEQAQGDFSPKTVKETRGFLDRTIVPGIGHVHLAKLKPLELDRFYRQLRASGGCGGRPLAPGTIRRIHGIIHRAMGQGVRWEWLTVNPASSASPPRVDSPEITPPSPTQLADLLTLAGERNPDLTTFLVVAAATGARRSEVVALRWTDIDFEMGAVTIARGIVLGPDGIVEKDTKTHQVRRIALDPTTVATLVEHRRRCATRAAAASALSRDDGFLFSQEVDGSRPWRPDSITLSFARLCRRAGIKGVRLHDLRHYVATRLLAGGIDVRTVAGRLGHRNPATTLNVYAHFLAEADRDAADMLGRVLDSARSATPSRT